MNLRDQIKLDEGWSLVPYYCTAGHKSIGAGWNLDANPLPEDMASYFRLHNAITQEMGEKLLDISIATASRQCKGIFPGFDQFSENRKYALISMMFMGVGHFCEFREMIKAILRGDWQRASDEMKYRDGLKKEKLSLYWAQLHGDPNGTDDKKSERPERIYKAMVEG